MLRSAIVVAGGYSRRFGNREKALVEFDGVPMLARVVGAVSPAVDELVINCRRDQRAAFQHVLERRATALEARFAVDRDPDEGPVAGLRRGLEEATGECVAAVPCDLPLLTPDLVSTLFDEYDRADASVDAVVPRVSGYARPLCAVYDARATLEACERVLESDRNRLVDVVDALETTSLDRTRLEDVLDVRRLRTVDTPDALDRLQ